MTGKLLPLLFVLISAFGLAGLAAPSASAGSGVDFWIVCPYTGHTATIDPIVDPGSTATAHFHDFYGNTNVTPTSTPQDLQNAGVGATSCTTSTDTAAYWAPELLLHPGETQTYGPSGFPCTTLANGDQACHYKYIRAYYSLGGSPRASLANLPFGMETVGGNSDATAIQPLSQATWSCGRGTPFEQYPYDCTPYINLPTGNDGVIMRLVMPSCWNGLDPTNRANFAYPPCNATFSHRLPVVGPRFHTGIVTPCPGQVCPPGSQVAPAFGFRNADDSEKPWYQLHADFMNGWQYGDRGTGDRLGGVDDLVTDCLILDRLCPPNPHTTPNNNMPT